MAKDYYAVLGVEKSASADEIKRAFRKKAHEYHPDKEGGDEAKFKEVNEAYQVLSDDTKRKQYDQFGQTFDGAGPGGGFGGFGGFGGQAGGMHFEDLGDLFGDLFGGMGGGSRGSRRARGQDILVDLEISFKESVFGVEKEVQVSKNSDCDRCGSTGAEPGTDMETCSTCSGQGFTVEVQRTMLGAMQRKVACQSCHGRGEQPKKSCSTCDGSGAIYGSKTLRVTIPAGVEDGSKMRIRGAGEAIGAQGDAGDLYIQLHVRSDPRFERQGATLYSTKAVGFTQAALGDEVHVDTVDGRVKLKVPAGTQSGDKLRIKGKGVATGRGRGDQIVIMNVRTPKKLSKQQKKLLEELDLRED